MMLISDHFPRNKCPVELCNGSYSRYKHQRAIDELEGLRLPQTLRQKEAHALRTLDADTVESPRREPSISSFSATYVSTKERHQHAVRPGH